MELLNLLLLLTTVILSAFRNIFSKKVSSAPFGSGKFFFLQMLIFISGGIVVTVIGMPKEISLETVLFALAYALFLLFAQWFYTAALARMKVSVCSTVYSLGFIIPTVVGTLFWKEAFSIFSLLGVLCAASAVVVSGITPKTEKSDKSKKTHFLLLIFAMLSSGMLGVIQKLQQSVPSVSTQKEAFIAIAFFTAAIASLIAFAFSKVKTERPAKADLLTAISTGAVFGICNLINTFLAGKLKSAVFFPVQNISVILISVILGKIIFKEAFNKKELLVFLLGMCAIILLSVF